MHAGTGNTGGSANGRVFIRGVGRTDFLFAADPGVGLCADAVYPSVAKNSALCGAAERLQVM